MLKPFKSKFVAKIHVPLKYFLQRHSTQLASQLQNTFQKVITSNSVNHCYVASQLCSYVANTKLCSYQLATISWHKFIKYGVQQCVSSITLSHQGPRQKGIHLITTGESLSSLTLKRLERRKKSQPSGDLNPRQHAV